MTTIAGLAVARGYAAGPVFVYRGDGEIPIPEYSVAPGGENGELLRFRRALGDVKRDIGNLISALKVRGGDADVRVFECHAMLAEDPTMIEECERYIAGDRVNAELAVRRTARNARAKFERMNDEYFRERVRDLDDVERRLLKALTGFSNEAAFALKTPSIVVADDLTPSETVRLPHELVLGFAMNGGSTTSHVALLARALGIPAVSGLGDITARVKPGEKILLDGTNGAVTLNPDADAEREFACLIDRQRKLVADASANISAGTLKNGEQGVLIYANYHPGIPMAAIREFGARGIGLYRSEYLWIGGDHEPTEEEQFEAYREAAKFTASLPGAATVTIRMLDIGGDKLLRGISTTEANPFLGNRSVRFLLSHRDVLRTQLRAVLRASAYGRIYMMYPMVSCVEELRECAVELAEARRSLDAEGIPYDAGMKVGIMIEVPSAALNAEVFAKYVDFFSIGTNDLVQYTMAADRGNDAVAHLYQPLNPAVVKLVRMSVDAAKRNGIKVGICGESAADPIVGVYWAALGVDMLSMSANSIPVVAGLLSRLTRADLGEYLKVPESMDERAGADEIMQACHMWMAAKIPDFDSIVI